MTAPSITAVVLDGPQAAATLEALAAQSPAVTSTLLVTSAGGDGRREGVQAVHAPAGGGPAAASEAGVRAAMESSADWIWLLDGFTVPTPGALDALLAPLGRLEGVPEPVLLASKIVGAQGDLDPDGEPWPRFTERDITVDAARQGLMSLRAARRGSLLVHRRAIQQYGLPRPDFVDDGDDLEWTARLLQSESGFLVPRSVVRRPAPREAGGSDDAHVYREVRNRLTSLRGRDTWVGEEKLWVGFLLAQRMARELRAKPRPRTAATLARGVRHAVRRPR